MMRCVRNGFDKIEMSVCFKITGNQLCSTEMDKRSRAIPYALDGLFLVFAPQSSCISSENAGLGPECVGPNYYWFFLETESYSECKARLRSDGN